MTGRLIELLKARGQTLAAAESLTGGLIAHLVVCAPGASSVLAGSAVVYTDEAKQRVLGVQQNTLARHTAVSPAVAREMALGAQALYGADYALSATGYAGPDGAQVGLTYLGLATPDAVYVYKLHLRGPRNIVRLQAAEIALALLHQELKGTQTHGNQE